MELLQHTLYINIDYRTDRRANVEAEFAKVGITPERFDAVKMQHGAVGCSMSHIKCLEMARDNGWPHVFICEDDIAFVDPETFKRKITDFAASGIRWDVLVVGGNNAPPFEPVSDFCVRVMNVQTTTGYVVAQHFYDTLIQNFREGTAKLMRNPTNKREFALDMYWKRLQPCGNWYMLIPPMAYQYTSFSDVEGRVVDYRGLMLDLDKKELIRYMEIQRSMNKRCSM